MALGILESREWDRHLKTPEDRTEYVAKLIPNLAKLLPIHDLNALRLLRPKLLDANVNWRSRCEKWETQWWNFLTSENDPYDPEDKSGRDIYAAWLQYAAECDSKGEPPLPNWDEEPFSEVVQSDSIITPPKTLFRLDDEIVKLLAEVHIWGMATLDEHYRKRVNLLLSAILYRSNFYVVWEDVKSQTGTVLNWIRDGIEALLRATNKALGLFEDTKSSDVAVAAQETDKTLSERRAAEWLEFTKYGGEQANRICEYLMQQDQMMASYDDLKSLLYGTRAVNPETFPKAIYRFSEKVEQFVAGWKVGKSQTSVWLEELRQTKDETRTKNGLK